MRLVVLTLFAVLVSVSLARADESFARTNTSPLYRKECGACHMVYEPAFLPQASWRRIMGSLTNHFGEDASLDPKARDKIEAYLVGHSRNLHIATANAPRRISAMARLPSMPNNSGSNGLKWRE